jgi:hypothetical protein
MDYKVVSIVPVQGDKQTGKDVAQELENVIKKYHAEGWEFVRVENLLTWVNPTGGCFGFGQTPGYNATRQMVVFKK